MRAPEMLISSALFCFHVVHIVLMRAKAKVRRIYAFRPIARMKNVKAFRDRADFLLIGHAMGAVSDHFAVHSFSECSVAFAAFTSSP
jgi:hypothetical protein